MNEDQIHDRALNRHLDEKFGFRPDDDPLKKIYAELHQAEERESAIMDYFTVMKDDPWQESIFGAMDNFQLTSAECGAMVKAWIDRRKK